MQLSHIKDTKLRAVGNIKVPAAFFNRICCGIPKLDTLFGGPSEKTKGILPGSSFTLTAAGGCGKTTLMLQYLEALAEQGYSVAIVSGEESVIQIAYTAQRLSVKKVKVANINNIDVIAQLMAEYDVIVIDSFQSMKPDAKVAKEKNVKNPKAVEKYCVETLTSAGKEHECVVGFIMHHTKGGMMKGGSIILHTVDANFCIWAPEIDNPTRWVETDGKNRFAPPGKFSAALTGTGYDFSVDAVEDEDDERKRMNGSSTGAGSAIGSSKGARRAKELEALKKLPLVTFKTGVSVIPDVQRLRFLLSDLHLEGVFRKEGRGQEAVFVNQLPEMAEQVKEALQK